MYEDVLIVAIVFSFAAFVCTGIFKLIRAKISTDSGINDEAFDRLAKAFIEHKKDMQQRVQNLEAIIVDEGEKDQYPQIEEPRSQGTLSNDLEQKNRVKS